MNARQAIRRAFARAAPGYDAAALLQQEVARRLAERLQVMRVQPALILDAGCGTGQALPLLAPRFPRVPIIGLDLALPMLQQARQRHAQGRGWRAWLRHLNPYAAPLRLVCGDVQQLPLADDSVDLIWSNLTLQWVGDLASGLREAQRVLRAGGLFLFSTFGPDTLKELRAAFAGIDDDVHVNRFIDMHDIGDLLIQTGFKHPVMEMEFITLTYADVAALLRDLKAIGANTVLGRRRSGLMGKAAWRRLQESYAQWRHADGRLPATFEVIYGHAWVGPKPAAQHGRRVFALQVEAVR